MKFNTTLDVFNKLKISANTIIFGCIICFKVINLHEVDAFALITIGLIVTLIYFATLLFRPLSYSLSNGAVVCNRLISGVQIYAYDIKEAMKINDLSTISDSGVFSAGGFFGYFAKLWNVNDGFVTFYATRSAAVNMIVTSSKKIYYYSKYLRFIFGMLFEIKVGIIQTIII